MHKSKFCSHDTLPRPNGLSEGQKIWFWLSLARSRGLLSRKEHWDCKALDGTLTKSHLSWCVDGFFKSSKIWVKFYPQISDFSGNYTVFTSIKHETLLIFKSENSAIFYQYLMKEFSSFKLDSHCIIK